MKLRITFIILIGLGLLVVVSSVVFTPNTISGFRTKTALKTTLTPPIDSLKTVAKIIEEEPTDSATLASRNGVDVLEVIVAMNSSKMPKPSAAFRKGVVSENSDRLKAEKTPNGFIISMPNQTNIPTPAVFNGNLYVSGGFGSKQYYSFKAKTGEDVWAVDLDDDGPSSCAIEDDVIVFNTESCTVFACELSTGKHLWSHWLGDPLMSMPTITAGKVFSAYPSNINSGFSHKVKYGSGEVTFNATHALASFDLKTGRILWQKWIDGDVMSAPVAEGNILYVTSFPGTVYRFDVSTGEILSARYMRATSAPVISNDEIIVSKRADVNTAERYEEISHVEKSSSKVIKNYMRKEATYLDKKVQRRSNLKGEADNMDAGNGFASGAPLSSGASFAEDNIGQSNVSSLQSFQGSRVVQYEGKNFNTMGDEVVCTDTVSGKVLWKSKLKGDLNQSGGFLGTPPVSAGGYIIVAAFNGEIKILNTKTGKVEQEFDTKSNIRYQPVVSEGWIYVTTTNGKLIAINTNNPKMTGWAMWGGNAAHTNKSL